MSLSHRQRVLKDVKQLLSLIAEIPDASKRSQALQEARSKLHERKAETDPEKILSHMKELAARIGYLRIITPRIGSKPAVSTPEGVTYVLRDGELVEGYGAAKGARVADGVLSKDEAFRKNNEHFKRFYGADKPKSMFF